MVACGVNSRIFTDTAGLLGLMLLMGCSSAPKHPSNERALLLEAVTIGVAHDTEAGGASIHCSGVLVSHQCAITAGHCLEVAGMDPLRAEMHVNDLDGDLPPWNPIGQPIPVYTREGYPRHLITMGHVLAWDHDGDLGAIRLDGPVDMPWARVDSDPKVGDWVAIVAQPAGYSWTYVEGLISQWRPEERNADHVLMNTLQVQGPIGPGFSGSGAFDTEGKLVGIASYIDRRVFGAGFFIHRNSVVSFLKQAGCLPASSR